MKEDLKVFLNSCIESHGFSEYGFAPVGRPLNFDLYQQWIDQNFHGEMSYLADHAPIKESPQKKWPRVKSALVFAMPYFPHPKPANLPLKQARLSLYSQGQDYHFWFCEKMNALIQSLKAQYPSEEFLSMTDSSPVLERDLAYRASLGWVGKNTCLIHPKKGSLFFIGEIYTSLNIQNDLAPLPDFCGTCTKCMDICPTQALLEPKKMDARKCISYLTIESRSVPELSLRASIGDWFFGCDLCQTACPWNQKAFKGQLSTALSESLDFSQENDLITDMRYILTSSGKKLDRDFFGTALARAGSFGLKRNALIVVGNRKLTELQHEVEALLEHPKLAELAAWTLQTLKS